jgi:hypothetical protein
MRIKAYACLLCLAMSPGVMASERTDARYAAVSALGSLNGVALQCRYIDQVRRMKTAIVTNVPKERSFGLAFDEATNDAFLAFIRNGDTCPPHEALQRRVGHAIDDLVEAVSNYR